ncbi:hypothetical protein M0813_17995 [Anaeramoeba flamelloides]|uniref:Uncharacterized protein n=1 Tax=Anaeramoeba flamelloides TaxID=1746091 RepID=A0ABQ8YTY0_9EUKA|nr:hypothetical protein M0813_17995 [Anaeramoeba flamelloides]
MQFLNNYGNYVIFLNQSNQILKKYKENIIQNYNNEKNNQYYTISLHILGKIIYEKFTSYLSKSFFTILNLTQDTALIKHCLDGIYLLIKLCTIFYIKNEKKDMVNSLLGIIKINSISEITKKQQFILNEFLHFAITENNYLNGNWLNIFNELLKLKTLGLLYLNKEIDIKEFNNDIRINQKIFQLNKNILKNKKLMDNYQNTSLNNLDQIIIQNENKIKIRLIKINDLIANSKKLNNENFYNFLKNLITIALQEINNMKKKNQVPFFLTIVFELILNNLHRNKIIWINIWEIVSQFMKKIPKNNEILIMVVINYLRIIFIKFIKLKPESLNSRYQYNLLSPLMNLLIINQRNQTNKENPKLILYCLQTLNYLINDYNQSFNSAWLIIFDLLKAISKSKNNLIFENSFQILINIYSNYFNQLKNHYFLSLLTCFFAFIENPINESINLKSLEYISELSKWFELNQSKYIINNENGDGDGDDNANVEDDDQKNILDQKNNRKIIDLVYTYWFPFFTGLSKVASNSILVSDQVKKKANIFLFQILKRIGKKLTKSIWKVIFQSVILPIFDEIFALNEQQQLLNSNKKWMQSIHFEFFQNVVDLFISLYEKTSFLALEILKFFEIIMIQNPSFASSIISSLHHLILKQGKEFNKETGTIFINYICKFLNKTLSTQLISFQNQKIKISKNQKYSSNDYDYKNTFFDLNQEELNYLNLMMQNITKSKKIIKTNSLIHLKLLKVCVTLFKELYTKIEQKEILLLLNTVKNSFEFAEQFKNNFNLRFLLFKKKFIKKKVPNLFQQEIKSKKAYLYFLNLLSEYQKKEYQIISEKYLYKTQSNYLEIFNIHFNQWKEKSTKNNLIKKNENEKEYENERESEKEKEKEKEKEISEYREHFLNELKQCLKEEESLIIYILQSLAQYNKSQLQKILIDNKGYQQLIKLIDFDNKKIKTELSQIFHKIGKIFNITTIN